MPTQSHSQLNGAAIDKTPWVGEFCEIAPSSAECALGPSRDTSARVLRNRRCGRGFLVLVASGVFCLGGFVARARGVDLSAFSHPVLSPLAVSFLGGVSVVRD